MKTVALFFLFLSLVPMTLAQEKKVNAIKSFEMNDEDTESFISAMRQFIRKLEKSPKDTTGFVAIAQNTSVRQKIVKEMLQQRPSLKNRIDYTRAGWGYDKSWENTEFWLIPKGADPPYKARTADYSCPSITIFEPKGLDGNGQLTFTANVAGASQDEPITYRWSVIGGDIVMGQGTPSVQVKLRSPSITSVSATLTIGGIDEEAACSTKSTLEFKIVP